MELVNHYYSHKIGAFVTSVYHRAVYGPESSMGHAWILVCLGGPEDVSWDPNATVLFRSGL